MFRRISALVVTLLAASPAFAQAPLDLIPQESVIALVARNQDELKKKGDRFLADTGLEPGIRPSQIFEFGYNFLGISKGLDPKGGPAIVLMGPEKKGERMKFERIEESIVVAVPFADKGEMASNFKLDAADLKPGAVIEGDPKRMLAKYFAAREKHLVMSGGKSAVERFLKSKSLGDALPAGRRRIFNDSDVLLQFAPRNAGEDWSSLADDIQRKLGKSDDPEQEEIAKQFVAGVRELRFALAGFSLDDGLDINFLTMLPRDGAASKLLKSFQAKPGACNLKGLPEGRVLAAQAFTNDGSKNAAFARALFDVILRETLEGPKLIAPTDRPNFVGIFGEIWRRLKGSRLAVYQNADETEVGLFSMVAILDADDAGKFLKEMKTLARIADGTKLDLTRKESKDGIDIVELIRDLGDDDYETRQSANVRLALIGEPALPYLRKAVEAGKLNLETKRRAERLDEQIERAAVERRKDLLGKGVLSHVRPTLAFVPKAEQRGGQAVDVVHVKLTGNEELAAGTMKQLLGPDWDKMRLAVVGNQVVVLVGSDTSLFDAAVKNVKDGSAGLAGTKAMTAFAKRSDPNRLLEFHFSVEAVLRLTNPKALPAPRKGGPQLTSFALTLDAESVLLDVRMPTAEAATVLRSVGILGMR